jgi:hypothetical protein
MLNRQLIICISLLIGCIALSVSGWGQLIIRGTVLDSGRVNYVADVWVKTNKGNATRTDTMGRYAIEADYADSIYFIYNNKATPRYAVSTIADYTRFDIALLIPIASNSKYKTIKEVVVFSKTYKQDSMENREAYADIFGYEKPGFKTSMSDGVAGVDLDELINIFRFRRNKNMRKFQSRLLQQEQDKYVDYRFNKKTVQQLTQLTGPDLDSFMVIFRPTYFFTINTPLYDFYWYIKMSGQQYALGARENLFFKRQPGLFIKEEE